MRARNRTDGDELGVTLIELMVVVVILGIVAAIGMPNLLSVRANAWEAQAQSDLANAALVVESARVVAGGDYPADQAAFDALDHTVTDPAMTLTYSVNGSRSEFCILLDHPDLPPAEDSYFANGRIARGAACPAFNNP